MGKPNATTTATLSCSFGAAPATLNVLPVARVMVGGKPAATIMDNLPIVNIPPFAMCTSMANPTVAAATAAALGVLTPMPCVPVVPAPWVPGSPTVLIGGKPALTVGCQAMCTWGGVIQVVSPSQVQTLSP
ncbi:MAG: DUF4280 domain-containing protein [Actinomycetales bacterium]